MRKMTREAGLLKMYAPKSGKADYKAGTRTEMGWDVGGGTYVWPCWMGHSGDKVLILATVGNRLYMSEDGGTTWRRILNAAIGSNSMIIATSNPVADKRVLYANTAGELWWSTNLASDDPATWELVLTASAGYFSWRYGWSVHNNIIVLSTYGAYNETNPPRFVYLSRDYGGTWTQIYERPINQMVDPSSYHIHDVCYDPWGSRIWLLEGDNVNNQILYSDDWGTTWNAVYVGSDSVQLTTITPLPDRVIFGSDSRPAGVYVWYRNMHENHAPVTAEDFQVLYTLDSFGEPQLVNISNHPVMDRGLLLAQYPYNLIIPMEGNQSTTPPRIIASPDGEHWWEIFRFDNHNPALKAGILGSVMGPVPNDPNRYIYAACTYQGVSTYFRIKMPEWIKIE